MNCINADELKSNLERVIKHGIATNGDHTITAEFLLKWVEENSFSVDVDENANTTAKE